MADIPTPSFISCPKTAGYADTLEWSWKCGTGDVPYCYFYVFDTDGTQMYSTTLTEQKRGVWTFSSDATALGLAPDTAYYAKVNGFAPPSYGAMATSPTFIVYENPDLTIVTPTDGYVATYLPLIASWTVETSLGVASVSYIFYDSQSNIVQKATADGYVRATQLRNIQEGEEYTLDVTVRDTRGGTTTKRVSGITANYSAPPATPTVTFENDPDSLSTTISVAFGQAGSGESATSTVSVERDGIILATLDSSGTVVDAIPPLGVGYTYIITALAANGSANISTVTNTFPTTMWALGAAPSVPLRFNPQISWSLDHGGELYHFAGGGLPVFYGTTEYDESGSLQFDTYGKDKADEIAALLREQPIQYLRDPYGHRWKALVKPSVTHGIGKMWQVSLDWNAVRWAE